MPTMQEWKCFDCKATCTREKRPGRPPKRCIDCRQKYNRLWKPDPKKPVKHAYYSQTTERQRRTKRSWILRRDFNIGADDYDHVLIAQGGGCALCCRTPKAEGRALAVDHDQSCCPQPGKSCGGCIRGLLCRNCNMNLIPAYLALPEDRRDSSLINDYLNSPHLVFEDF